MDNKMSKLLIVADTAEVCAATPRGLELAAKLNLEVEVVVSAYASLTSLKVTKAQSQKFEKRLRAEREKSIKALVSKYAQPRQKVAITTIWEKNLDRWVIKQCASGKYMGVVKSGSGQGSLVQEAVDWQLLRKCAAPVLLVAKKKWHRTKPLLVALDLSTSARSNQALNKKILAIAKGLAAAMEVELKIISVIEIPTLLSDLDLIDPAAYVRDAKAEMQPAIAKLAAAHDIPHSAFVCKHGPTEKVIASYAARVRAQMVVMGTVARKGIKARLLGNTAEKVIQHLKTDVLAVKP
jgi:universal stress protein E